MKSTHVVIMAGGVGSRFWPLSTPELPKQFIDILGCGKTLIQLTVDRFRGVCPMDKFWVVTNKAYVPVVRQQLPGIPESHILPEPCARNTAPCIAWASWSIRREDPDANIVVTPADAVVTDPEEFRRVTGNALDFISGSASIVTVGIRPSRPETGYGYLQAAEAVPGSEIVHLARFREKPDLDTAKAFLAAGNYLWNAGIFVWNVQTIAACLQRYEPQIAGMMDRMFADGTPDGQTVEELFPQCNRISIDFAVMEPAAADGLVYTHPADFGWSDLGNWQSLRDRLLEVEEHSDARGNGFVGNVFLHECRDCVVHAEDASKVVLQGLEGYIVSVKDGRVLVCRRTEEQRIREFSTE